MHIVLLFGAIYTLSRMFRRRCEGTMRRPLLPGLLHKWCWQESRFTWHLVFKLAQSQLADAFAEELTEPLHVVSTGNSEAILPAADVERQGRANAVGDLLLRPAMLLACCSQQEVWPGMCCFLDHPSLRIFI